MLAAALGKHRWPGEGEGAGWMGYPQLRTRMWLPDLVGGLWFAFCLLCSLNFQAVRFQVQVAQMTQKTFSLLYS